jgi:hypothetical protein
MGTRVADPSPPLAASLSAENIVHTEQVAPIFVEEGSRLQHDMRVKNQTDRAVHFTRVQPSCACSGGTTLDSMDLGPGEETLLHFDVDLRYRTGPQRFVCYLYESSGEMRTYAVETTLYDRARFEGSGAVHFGMVDPNAEEVREAELRFHATDTTMLPADISFHTESECLRVQVGVPTVQQQADGIVVKVVPLKLHLQAPKNPGFGSAHLHARFTQAATASKLAVSTTVMAKIQGGSPAALHSGIQPSGLKHGFRGNARVAPHLLAHTMTRFAVPSSRSTNCRNVRGRRNVKSGLQSREVSVILTILVNKNTLGQAFLKRQPMDAGRFSCLPGELNVIHGTFSW